MSKVTVRIQKGGRIIGDDIVLRKIAGRFIHKGCKPIVIEGVWCG